MLQTVHFTIDPILISFLYIYSLIMSITIIHSPVVSISIYPQVDACMVLVHMQFIT